MFKSKKPEGIVKELDFIGGGEDRPALRKHLTEEDCKLIYRTFLNRLCELQKYFISEENKNPKEVRGKLERVISNKGNFIHLFIFPGELKYLFSNCCIERHFLNMNLIKYERQDKVLFKEFIKWLKGNHLLPNGTGNGSEEDLSLDPRVILTPIGDFYHDTIEIIINSSLAQRKDEIEGFVNSIT